MDIGARIGAILIGLAMLAGSAGITATPAEADPWESALQRANFIMNQTYNGFLVEKQLNDGPFVWSSDGCSWTPLPWSWEQDLPCQQHDFGYRNFGKGLRLDRTEDRRGWLDQRFLTEMLRNCDAHPWYPHCVDGAYTMYAAVRNFNDWHD